MCWSYSIQKFKMHMQHFYMTFLISLNPHLQATPHTHRHCHPSPFLSLPFFSSPPSLCLPPASHCHPPLWYVKHILILSKQNFTQVYTSTIKQNRGAAVETCKMALWPVFMQKCWQRSIGLGDGCISSFSLYTSLSLSLSLQPEN